MWTWGRVDHYDIMLSSQEGLRFDTSPENSIEMAGRLIQTVQARVSQLRLRPWLLACFPKPFYFSGLSIAQVA